MGCGPSRGTSHVSSIRGSRCPAIHHPVTTESPGKGTLLVTSTLDAELLLGGQLDSACPSAGHSAGEEGVSWGHGRPGSKALGHLPTLPASRQGTRRHSASNSCPTGAKGLGLCCLQLHPRHPMGDEPLPGNQSPTAKGASGFPEPEGAVPQSWGAAPPHSSPCILQCPRSWPPLEPLRDLLPLTCRGPPPSAARSRLVPAA